MPKSTIPHTAEVEATVNAPELVTLYASDGEAIQVEAAKVEAWLRRGFTRQPFDLDGLVSEVAALAKAVAAPWADYAAACKAAGHIDNVAQDTARAALDLLNDAAHRLHLGIHQTFAPAPAATDEE
jgi:hypothetical protein